MSTFLTYITAIDSATRTITVASTPSEYQLLSVINVLQMSANRHLQGADGDTLKTLSDQIDGVGSIAGQDIADALLLAPVGAAAAGSAMDYLADIVEDTGTTLPVLISAGGGTGLYSETITVNDLDGSPVDGVLVQVATDSGFSNIIRSGYTNGLGQVTFNYDAAGTYYGRAEIAGYGVQTFTVEVSA